MPWLRNKTLVEGFKKRFEGTILRVDWCFVPLFWFCGKSGMFSLRLTWGFEAANQTVSHIDCWGKKIWDVYPHHLLYANTGIILELLAFLFWKLISPELLFWNYSRNAILEISIIFYQNSRIANSRIIPEQQFWIIYFQNRIFQNYYSIGIVDMIRV
jgi:hypothetical protein